MWNSSIEIGELLLQARSFLWATSRLQKDETMMSDTFLPNAATFFLAAWSAVIAGVGVIAFGRDILPVRPSAKSDSLEKTASQIPRSIR